MSLFSQDAVITSGGHGWKVNTHTLHCIFVCHVYDGVIAAVLHSDPTPTFSHTAPSAYTPFYEVPNSWDCITVISKFPDTVPTYPLDILPRLAPEPVDLGSLLRSWPYFSHRFTEFHPYYTDRDLTELRLIAQTHQTYRHTLEHSSFCYECVCPTHYPYGGNRLAK